MSEYALTPCPQCSHEMLLPTTGMMNISHVREDWHNITIRHQSQAAVGSPLVGRPPGSGRAPEQAETGESLDEPTGDPTATSLSGSSEATASQTNPEGTQR